MSKLKMATVWLDGCSGCHMSFLDLDERLIELADIGEKVAPSDPRGKFYRAVGLILEKQNADEAESLLRLYLEKAPKRDGFPRYAMAHEWLGRAFESKG